MVDTIKSSGFALNAQHKDDLLLVEGYGNGCFKMRGNRAAGSMIILPSGFFPLGVQTLVDIEERHLSHILNEKTTLDLVLIGTGEKMTPLPKSLKKIFQNAGLATEFMDTGAASRTFNVLTLEERRVAAVLIAV